MKLEMWITWCFNRAKPRLHLFQIMLLPVLFFNLMPFIHSTACFVELTAVTDVSYGKLFHSNCSLLVMSFYLLNSTLGLQTWLHFRITWRDFKTFCQLNRILWEWDLMLSVFFKSPSLFQCVAKEPQHNVLTFSLLIILPSMSFFFIHHHLTFPLRLY